MREGISVSSIFMFVILFVLLFAGIMALTINNSNAFGVKNEIINIINEKEGNYLDNNGNLVDDLVDAIAEISYRTTGKCDDDYTGYARNGERVSNGSSASICIKKVDVTSGLDNYLSNVVGAGQVATGEFMSGSYYQVEVFYSLDIPVIQSAFNFKIKGETRIIYGN